MFREGKSPLLQADQDISSSQMILNQASNLLNIQRYGKQIEQPISFFQHNNNDDQSNQFGYQADESEDTIYLNQRLHTDEI